VNALFRSAERAPPFHEFFQVHELHRRHQVGPGHGVVALVATPLLRSRRGHLSLREFQSGCIRRCCCVRISFCQDCRLRLHDDLGVKSSCPADDPQIFRVDGAEPDELCDFFFVC
jgi:hypothetical protein